MSFLTPSGRSPAAQLKVHIEDPDALNRFANALLEKLLKQELPPERPRLLVCIGTDRSTGDSLGPIVGSRLQDINHRYFQVLGTLDSPVHASNLSEYIKIIEQLHNPFVIAIDACLGNLDNVGCINLGEGALKPGAGVNKHLPAVGDLHITGVVNVGGFMEYFVLQNTRLNLVMKMGKLISRGIEQATALLGDTRHLVASTAIPFI